MSQRLSVGALVARGPDGACEIGGAVRTCSFCTSNRTASSTKPPVAQKPSPPASPAEAPLALPAAEATAAA
eukprot:CAMPEP_0177284626 /NCGR_PEP_ID=MMETSP0367-20130122/72622_1 /TAXON_ID=447022 ORGANISM="Scrippsiella hangoei-like, Strain SHHI-4" /NCGR_SAMPLE_ID=MMETSP0367 /ASSEMBLY_ACC=CAM_ASM_000362 /LENGTH=70 /DNA_ID=CAMNT_0018741683 /DNA_START=177 /DNA_END=386 /DNA_ORIENTATION=-